MDPTNEYSQYSSYVGLLHSQGENVGNQNFHYESFPSSEFNEGEGEGEGVVRSYSVGSGSNLINAVDLGNAIDPQQQILDNQNLFTLVFLILQFLDEEKFKESVHKLEQESGFHFNIKYFEEKALAGEWDEVEKYLSAFTKVDDNRDFCLVLTNTLPAETETSDQGEKQNNRCGKRKDFDKKVKSSTKKKNKSSEENEKLPYVHVRARHGQATDSHSLAERLHRRMFGGEYSELGFWRLRRQMKKAMEYRKLGDSELNISEITMGTVRIRFISFSIAI
ncbi:LIS1 homology motif protein [Raphanus sativus]|nr:LIS1 homology motif protein [Raphanus sativus]